MVSNDSSQNRRCHHHWGTIQLLQMKPLPRRRSRTPTIWLQKKIMIWFRSRLKAPNVPITVAKQILGQFARFVLNRSAVCTWASITEVARRIQNFTNNRGATTIKSPLVQIVVADNAVAAVLQAVAHYRTAIVRVARHHLVTSLPRTSKRTKLFRTKDQSLMLQHAKMTLWHKSRRSFAPSAENAYLKQ